MNREDHNRLVELYDELQERIEEVRQILRYEGGIQFSRAKAYWLTNIEESLRNNGNHSSFTMEYAINALKPIIDEDEDDSWDDSSGTLGGYERNAGRCVGGDGE